MIKHSCRTGNGVSGNIWRTLYDGATNQSPILGEYCGYELPPNLVTSTNKAFIYFQSDSSDTNNGFKLEYNPYGDVISVQPTTPTAMTSSTDVAVLEVIAVGVVG